MTVGQNYFKVIPLLLLFYINYAPITCQNCGLPSVIRVGDQLKESLDTGQPLIPKPIPARNVVDIVVTQNPNNFANVTLTPENCSEPYCLSLEVATPLWDKATDKPSFIDEFMWQEITIVVELNCSDGRTKEVQIIFPIIDENTAMPLFEQTNYNFTTEYCLQDRCVLTLSKDIMVIDQDRDPENGRVHVWTDIKSIHILSEFNTPELWFDDNKYGGKSWKGYQSKIRLEYAPNEKTKLPRSINFTLFTNNTVPFVDDREFEATSMVTIAFEANPNIILPPEFSYSYYYAYVDLLEGTVVTKPATIFAYALDPDHPDFSIRYKIKGESDVLRIDENNGHLFLDSYFMSETSNNTEGHYYEVIAERVKRATEDEDAVVKATATVPLVVFFAESPGCECDSTTTPDPCPTPTTEEPITDPEYTTTEIPPTLTTPSPPPILPPGNCTCNCTNFSCADPSVDPSFNSGSYLYYQDPYHCTKYHLCPIPLDDGRWQQTHDCPSDMVFCPQMTACTTVEMCLIRNNPNVRYPPARFLGYGDGDGDDDEGKCRNCTCREGLPPNHKNNVCTPENYEDHISDLQFADMFHQCQPISENTNKYIDFPMRCPTGTVFCESFQTCAHPYACKWDKYQKEFKLCEVCKMGLWPGFDVFEKRFIEDSDLYTFYEQ